jgi:hypothetical protein
MEADWSVELAADDPVIVVPWRSLPGAEGSASSPIVQFIDLRARPHSIDEIGEAWDRPALRFALEKLNAKDSGLWTAKCDQWMRGREESGDREIDPIDPIDRIDQIDPWEMEATREEARFAAGSYIDILALDIEARGSFAIEEGWVRRLAESLRHRELRCARTDFVLRRAEIHGVPGFGVTWFVEGCGGTAELAERKWTEALTEALPVVLNTGLVEGTLQ